MKKEERYLFPADYMADPSVHVFNGRLYIYPSHDRESLFFSYLCPRNQKIERL